MRAGFDPDWIQDLDMLSFESLTETVELERLGERHERFVDHMFAAQGDSKAVDKHQKEIAKAINEIRGNDGRVDDLARALGG